MPPALARKPPPKHEAPYYLRAFHTLHERRPIAVGVASAYPMKILLSEMQAYCALYGVRDVEVFVDVITALDRGYTDD